MSHPDSLTCWCGADATASPENDVAICRVCGTLIRSCSPVLDLAKARQGADIEQYDDLRIFSAANLSLLMLLSQNMPPPAKVLVIGGAGALSSLFSTLGFQVTVLLKGNEFDFRTAQAVYNVQLVRNEDFDAIASRFDAILIVDQIERTPVPAAIVSRCLKNLDADGVILVKTRARLGRAFGPAGKADVYAFTPDALTRLLSENGLRRVQMEAIDRQGLLLATAARHHRAFKSTSIDEPSPHSDLVISLLGEFFRLYENINGTRQPAELPPEIDAPSELSPEIDEPADLLPIDKSEQREMLRLKNALVAHEFELVALRWEVGSMLLRSPSLARSTKIKQIVRRYFPSAAQKRRQMMGLAEVIATKLFHSIPRIGAYPHPSAMLLKRPSLVLDRNGVPNGFLSRQSSEGLTVLRGGGGLTGIFNGTAEIEGALGPPANASFAEWLISGGRIRQFGTIIVGAGDAISKSLLRGRLTREQQLLVSGQGDSQHEVSEDLGRMKRVCDGLLACDPVPDSWLDPLDKHLQPDLSIVGLTSWPRISVVIVSYNQVSYLEEALCSVLSQGYPQLEIIVVDACSDDGSATILERYRHRLDSLLIEPDNGQADGLNKGFARATGEILTWLNSDDLLEPGTLFRVAQSFTAHEVDMVVGGCRQIGTTRSEIIRNHHTKLPLGLPIMLPLGLLLDVDRYWLTATFFYQPEVFFTRDIWERSGGYLRADLHYVIDYDLWVRMAAAGATIVHIPDYLACSRTHAQQKTKSGALPFLPELRQLLREYSSRILTLK